MSETLSIVRVRARDIRLSDEVLDNGLTFPVMALLRGFGNVVIMTLDAEPRPYTLMVTGNAEIDVVRS